MSKEFITLGKWGGGSPERSEMTLDGYYRYGSTTTMEALGRWLLENAEPEWTVSLSVERGYEDEAYPEIVISRPTTPEERAERLAARDDTRKRNNAYILERIKRENPELFTEPPK